MNVLTSKNQSSEGVAIATAKAFRWLWDDPDRADAEFWCERSTDKQRELRWAIRESRQVSCASANGQGKTHTIAKTLVEFILANCPAYAIATSASWDTLRQTLLPQFRQRASVARRYLHGFPIMAPSQTAWWPGGPNIKWAVLSISPKEPENAAGRHNDRVLAIVDEASGLNPKILTAIQGITTRPDDRLVLSGNPLEDSGVFYDSHNRNKGAWRGIVMDALESPNVIAGRMVFPGMSTREWVDERRSEWGEDSPEFQARVRGRFPVEGSMTIVTRRMIEDAMARYAPGLPRKGKLRMGVDPAYAQRGDMGVIVAVDDVCDRHLWSRRGSKAQEFEGMIKSAYRDWGVDEGWVDDGGLAGLGDRLVDDGLPIRGCTGGEKPFDEMNFANVKTECLFAVRSWLEAGGALSPDLGRALLDECGLQYKVLRSGKKQAESREEVIERIGHSIDYTSAFGLALRRKVGASVIKADSDLAACKYHDKPVLVPLASKPGEYGLWPYSLRMHDGAGIAGEIYRATWWDRRGDSASLIVHRAMDGVWTVTQAEMMAQSPGVSMESFAALIDRVARDGGGKPFDFAMDVYGGAHDAEDGEVFYGDLLRMYLERARKDDSQGALYHVPVKYISGMAGMDALLELVRGTKKALDSGTAGEMLVCWPDEVLEQIAEARYKPETKQAVGDVVNTELIGGGGALVRCLRMLLVSRAMMG